MLLSREESDQFFKLHCALMQFVNEQVRAVVDDGSAEAFSGLPVEKRREVVRAFLGRLDLIDAFIGANPARLSQEELDTVSSWRHLVSGRFVALRQLKKHMILLSCSGSQIAYGVTGLTEPMERVIPTLLPSMIETVLLPFRGRIVYDGLVSGFNVMFGSGSRRAFEDDFRIAKASNGVATSLPIQWGAKELGVEPRKPKLVKAPEPPVAAGSEILKDLVALTDAFCHTHLNEEYAALCQKLAAKLAAKRPPLLRGKLETWASGIIRAIGWANFLDDRSQSPHLKLPVIDRAFGIGESTGQGRAKEIRQMLKIRQFDHRWTLPSRWESAPMIWLLQDSNGRMIDIRKQPVSMQRAAFKQGLIPYVPADRVAAAVQERISTSPSRQLFQFKITLRESNPVIWRRIQVWDDTLDKLHEHLQMAMGWTNSHLHEFLIQGQHYGDPELLDDDFEPFEGLDSTGTLMSAVLPADRGAPLLFEYHYDFGDSWVHDVLWEGCPPCQPGTTYPQCLEGERACPPEDVGGIRGYAEYLKAISDPDHEEHRESLDWSGRFDPNTFSPTRATHLMQEGVPDWRNMV